MVSAVAAVGIGLAAWQCRGADREDREFAAGVVDREGGTIPVYIEDTSGMVEWAGHIPDTGDVPGELTKALRADGHIGEHEAYVWRTAGETAGAITNGLAVYG